VLASGAAIGRRWPAPDGINPARALFDAADAGDPSAVAVRHEVAQHLASAVLLLILTLDVEVVVLGLLVPQAVSANDVQTRVQATAAGMASKLSGSSQASSDVKSGSLGLPLTAGTTTVPKEVEADDAALMRDTLQKLAEAVRDAA
jgi:predicted NBD/HSP70 family sugar kinase